MSKACEDIELKMCEFEVDGAEWVKIRVLKRIVSGEKVVDEDGKGYEWLEGQWPNELGQGLAGGHLITLRTIIDDLLEYGVFGLE